MSVSSHCSLTMAFPGHSHVWFTRKASAMDKYVSSEGSGVSAHMRVTALLTVSNQEVTLKRLISMLPIAQKLHMRRLALTFVIRQYDMY